MKNKVYKNASNQLTFEIFDLPAEYYMKLCSILEKEMKLKKLNNKNKGFDEVFEDYEKEGMLVSLEWDNWSGFMVVAKNEYSEPLLREISKYLATNKDVVKMCK